MRDDGWGGRRYDGPFTGERLISLNASSDTQNRGAPGWAGTPLARVLLTQAIGAAIAFAAAFALSAWAGASLPLFAVLVATGVIAAWLGGKMRLARWWIPVQMNLGPAAALVSLAAVPPWLFLAAFILLGLVYWNSARNRVPLYLTNRTTFDAIAQLIPATLGARFLDVGHGIGGILIYLAPRCAGVQLTGIESAPLPFMLSWLRAPLNKYPNLTLRYGDFWKLDFGDYDMVYAFLSPEPMPALYDKVRREMKPGTMFVSNSFAVPGVPPDKTIVLDDRRKTKLHIWKI